MLREVFARVAKKSAYSSLGDTESSTMKPILRKVSSREGVASRISVRGERSLMSLPLNVLYIIVIVVLGLGIRTLKTLSRHRWLFDSVVIINLPSLAL